MSEAEKRVLILEELIRQHMNYKISIKDFDMADQILWQSIIGKENNDTN